jgi:hypothetical protein
MVTSHIFGKDKEDPTMLSSLKKFSSSLHSFPVFTLYYVPNVSSSFCIFHIAI